MTPSQIAKRSAALIRTHGIALRHYNEMLAIQGGKCAICRQSPKEKILRVDHCHKRNRNRGLLCDQCNLALGSFRDSIENLKRAVAYLQDAANGQSPADKISIPPTTRTKAEYLKHIRAQKLSESHHGTDLPWHTGRGIALAGASAAQGRNIGQPQTLRNNKPVNNGERAGVKGSL